jgi:glycine/D-amino acid oxidase-like deaminating enzyme
MMDMPQGGPSSAPTKVAVIGGGVIGLATALRLQQDGCAVVLFDPEPPGSQTSSGNAALIMTAQISPLSQPGLWKKVPAMLFDPTGPLVVRWQYLPRLAPWFLQFLANSTWKTYERIAEALTPLVTRSLDAWIGLVGQAEAARLFRRDGLLYVFRKPENFEAAKKEATFRARYGIPSEIIPSEELKQMEPELAPGLAGGLLYTESAHTVEPLQVSAAVLEAFIAAGGVVRRERVERLIPDHGKLRVVTAAGGTLFDHGVVSAGVWSLPLVAHLAVRPKMTAERGYHLMLPEPGVALRRPIGAGDDKFIITPLATGIRLAGTAEFASIDAEPDWRRSDILLPLAQRLVPGLKNGRSDRWMGRRPSTPDSMPIIGRVRGAPQVICAFGHGHLGLTLAAVTSEIVSDLIAGKPEPASLAAFSPYRF